MQGAVHNRATMRVADTTEVSGRVTADEIGRGLRTEKESNLRCIAGATVHGFLMAAYLFVALAPMPARAQGTPAAIADLQREVAALQLQVDTLLTGNSALQTQVNTLQSQVNTLQTSNSALQSQVNTLQTSNSALQTQVNTLQTQLAAVQSNKALLLGPFVDVDPNPENGVIGPNIKFTGANIHILSGSNATDDNLSHGGTLTGLGNLIVGYDELNTGQVANRGGSHNLVIGRFHAFTSSAFGGLVAGSANTISAEAASVSGGSLNTASGLLASVIGGFSNTASGISSVVLGETNITNNTVLSIRPQAPFSP